MTRLALIGCGRWGQHILRTLQSMEGVDVSDVVSTEKPNIELGAARWRSTLEELPLAELDGVIVATPGSTHAAVALPLIEQGLPVFIEKPLATRVADAEAIATAAVQREVPVMVGHIHRYNPAWQIVERLTPGLGTLRALHFEGTNMGPFRDDMSVLWDWGPHAVSLGLALMGEPPVEVHARGQRSLRPTTQLYDTVWLTLRWANDTVMTAHLSWLFPEKRTQMTLIGTESALVWNDRAERKVTLYRGIGPMVAHTGVYTRDSSVEYPSVPAQAPLAAELAAFVGLVQAGVPVPTDVTEGLSVVRILATAERSLELDGAKMSMLG